MTSPTSIRMENGSLNVPNHPIIPFIEGDGIGPDIWEASVNVFDSAVKHAYGNTKKIDWLEVLAGEKPKTTKDQKELLTKVADHLGERVSEVLPSSRLKDSACCLVLQSNEPGIQLRKILEAAGQKMGDAVPMLRVFIPMTRLLP